MPSALLALQRATHATLHLISSALADLDLTAAELNALANLSDGQARTVSQLGAAVGSRPTTLTSVLDRLERRGLVTRTTRAADRRSVLIELTENGAATADEIARTIADLEAGALHDVSPRSVAGFHVVLRALTGANA